jgi:1-acyl-sn-glycerol-3-phosphate acyltransferase
MRPQLRLLPIFLRQYHLLRSPMSRGSSAAAEARAVRCDHISTAAACLSGALGSLFVRHLSVVAVLPLRRQTASLHREVARLHFQVVIVCVRRVAWAPESLEGRLDRRAPIIVIAPHLGLYDMFCMMYTARCPRPIAMATWGKNPLIRAIFDAVDGIGVRFTPNCTTPANQATAKVAPLPAEAITATKPRSGAAAVREAIVEHKRDFCTGDKPIAILPEGTTSNGRALLKFFSGAFEGGGTVQPVLLTYSFSHYNAAAFITSAPAHVGRALLNAPPCRQS